jgi:hypothetical protein
MGGFLDQLSHYCASLEVVLLSIQVTVSSLETGTFSEKNINNNIIFQHVFQTTVLITFNNFCLNFSLVYGNFSVLFMFLIYNIFHSKEAGRPGAHVSVHMCSQ